MENLFTRESVATTVTHRVRFFDNSKGKVKEM